MIDLKKAITTLAENDVEYVIVGGVAVSIHASGYITQDLDLCYSRSKENIHRLFTALSQFNPMPRDWPEGLPFIFDESTLRNGTNFTFDTLIGAIDLLGEVKGIGDYAIALANSDEYIIYDVRVKVFTLDALIDSKAAANRPKDHLVLPELLALREALDPTKD